MIFCFAPAHVYLLILFWPVQLLFEMLIFSFLMVSCFCFSGITPLKSQFSLVSFLTAFGDMTYSAVFQSRIGIKICSTYKFLGQQLSFYSLTPLKKLKNVLPSSQSFQTIIWWLVVVLFSLQAVDKPSIAVIHQSLSKSLILFVLFIYLAYFQCTPSSSPCREGILTVCLLCFFEN